MYKVVFIRLAILETELNNLEKLGWQLVQIAPGIPINGYNKNSVLVAIFHKEKPTKNLGKEE